jgi:hypothetical protein
MPKTSRDDPQSFSFGIDRFLDCIRPYAKAPGGTIFPRGLSETSSRRNPDESLHSWFKGVVDDLGPEAPASVAIEENIGVLASIKWGSNKILKYANIQVIVAEASLEDYYLDSEINAIYLRLDCDELTLGEPFSHPHPHIHLESSLSPRFALDGGFSENVVVDFMEFLYRHYKPSQWLAWAERTWNEKFEEARIGDEDNPFPIIVDAFRTSQIQILRDYALTLTRLKTVLKNRKDNLLDLKLDPKDRELLEYPLAR